MKFLSALLASFVTTVSAQTLSQPVVQWVGAVSPASYGTGVTMSPDGTLAIFTSDEGVVTALDSASGTFMWQVTPSTDSGAAFCNSGITTSESANFFVVGISNGVEDDTDTTCTVYSVTFDGTATAFPALTGQCSGTPVISNDDSYIFLTHNSGTTGIFSVLDVASQSLYYNETNDVQPFSPPGIYHKPSEGYYPGGEGNTNDIVIWAHTPAPGESGVSIGNTFAFQFPIGFFAGFNTDGLTVIELNTDTNWQAVAAPKITNNGYSMYFSSSRSSFRGWSGAPLDVTDRFNRDGTSVGFSRGSPPSQPSFASLALSSSTSTPMIYGGTASNEFVALDYEMNTAWEFATSFTIEAEARVSPGDDVVYFVEKNGVFHAVDALTGTSIFSDVTFNAPVSANFALTESGRTIIAVDQAGNAVALQVAEVATDAPVTRAPVPPTEAPITMTPTVAPITSAPTTNAPVTSAPADANATEAPVDMTSAVTAAPVTSSPVAVTTPAPVAATTPAPVAATTPAPTPAPVEDTAAPVTASTTTSAPTSDGAKSGFLAAGVTAFLVASVMLM